jgi:hypothetical protein
MRYFIATALLAVVLGCAQAPKIRLDLMPLIPQLVYNVAEATQACTERFGIGCMANRIGGCKCDAYTVPYGVWVAAIN